MFFLVVSEIVVVDFDTCTLFLDHFEGYEVEVCLEYLAVRDGGALLYWGGVAAINTYQLDDISGFHAVNIGIV